jgi:hypothetical protein
MPMGPRRRRGGVVGTVAKVAVVGGAVHHVTSKNAQKGADAQAQQYEAQSAQDQADAQAAQDQAVSAAVADTKKEAEQEAEMEKMQQQMAAMQAQQAAGATAAPAAAAAAPAAAGDDLMGQLNQLAQLHSAGVLDDAEFAAAKAKLLG